MSKPKSSEAIVKELARKEYNKKCFDCGRGGPQQNVNLTLNTFVCTSCSGLLRNFNHKCKTINMYTFPEAEVKALEEGGNKKARAYWLHFYDPENPREYKVDPDEQKSVLDFMKMMYENKKWCIEQPKKEEPKKEKKKKKKGEAEHSEERPRAESRDEGEKDFAPSKPAISLDAAALKLKEPTKAEKRSRKSAGPGHSDEGQASSKTSAPTGGLDFLSNLGALSFDTPAAAPAKSSGGFGGDDFGASFDSGFGGAPAASSGGFDSFDAGFGGASASSGANGFGSFGAAPVVAPVASSSSSGSGDGLAGLVQKASAVKVNPQAVSALVYQIKAIAGQYQLDAQHTQAMVLQALGKIAAEPPAPAGAKANGTAGGLDAFSDLPLPEDGPGNEPDSGNPFGSDDDDDDDGPAAGAFGAPQPSAGFGGGFGAPQGGFGAPAPVHQQGFGAPQQSFGAPQQGFGAAPQQGFGAPQQGFGAPQQGFGAPQQGFGGGFGAPQGGFGAPQGGFGAPQATAGGFGSFGAPQQQQQQQPKPQTDMFSAFNPF